MAFSHLKYFLFFYNCIVPMGFPPWEIWVAFPRESQLQQSRATQPTVHAGCFSVSVIHQTLTWTTGSLTCAQMLMHAIAHRGVRTHVRESALKADSGRKIPCRTGESNVPQRRAGLPLFQQSFIPTPIYDATPYFLSPPEKSLGNIKNKYHVLLLINWSSFARNVVRTELLVTL